MPVEWFGDKVEKEVDAKAARYLDALGIIGETDTKRRITRAGRVDTGRMRADITHETDAKELVVRWGGNVKYLVYQELGTVNADGSQRITPGFFLRDSLLYVKSKADKVKV